MDASLKAALRQALGSEVASARPQSGGDINDAFAIRLKDGRRLFVKANHQAPTAMFAAEKKGLAWLAEANALRVPEVIAVSDTKSNGPRFLVLELIEPARRCANFGEQLGRALAALHRFGAPAFGLDEANFIGRLPQNNQPCDTWVDFYRERRLLPQIRLAEKQGLLGRNLVRQLSQLLDRLEPLVGPAEPPSRLHGDLWGGNLHVDDAGAPCLIDPAVYGGHREVDLAMMRLFGGFSNACFAAYAEAFPLAPGHQERVPLYQLYPLLVHVNLFGSSYASGVERAISRYITV